MKTGRRGTVLVLGDDSRSCLAVVRSLGRQRIRVLLGTQSEDSIVPHSRYVARTIPMSSTKTQLHSWLEELHALLQEEPVELIIPCSDSTLVPLAEHRAAFERLAMLAIPDEVGFRCTYFKDKTLAMARELDVPIPTTVLVENMADLRRIESQGELSLPLVVKPVSSKVWKDGKRFDLRVGVIRELSSLASRVRGLLEVTPVLVQSYCRGIGVGQEFLVHEGGILSAFQHERVHEPLGGGGSSYRRSVPLDGRLLAHSTAMLRHLRWTGVAMVEYKGSPETGDFALMEINGRFWGSLPLAVAAGADFPYQLYRALVARDLRERGSYKVGVYSRNLMADLGWLKERVEDAASRRSAWHVVLKEIGCGVKRVLAGRERWDTITVDDVVPGLVEIGRVIALLRRACLRRIERRVLAVAHSSGVHRWTQRRKLRRLLRSSPRVLFVCRGNVCRSPFAEAYARSRLDRVGMSHIETESAGTHPLEKRHVQDLAQRVGLECGVVLERHRSCRVNTDLVRWAGAILCMDYSDYDELRTAFPNARERLFFLGALDPTGKHLEIADPGDKPLEDVRLVFSRIRASTEGLIQVLRD